jgi:hypothetical protein
MRRTSGPLVVVAGARTVSTGSVLAAAGRTAASPPANSAFLRGRAHVNVKTARNTPGESHRMS